MWVWLSAEGAKNVSSHWLSPIRKWGSLTMTSLAKFLYMANHFNLLRLNPFRLRIDSEGWWFERSLSYLRVCLSAEDAKNVSWPWLSPIRGWGSLTMTSIAKFVYRAKHFILLRLNPFVLRVDSEGWWVWALYVIVASLLVSRRCKNVCWPWLSPHRRLGSLTMTSIGKFVCMAHHFILLPLNPFGLSVDSEGWWFEHSMS